MRAYHSYQCNTQQELYLDTAGNHYILNTCFVNLVYGEVIMLIDELIMDMEILDRIISKSSRQVNLLELESAASVLNRHYLPPMISLFEARAELSTRLNQWQEALKEDQIKLGFK